MNRKQQRKCLEQYQDQIANAYARGLSLDAIAIHYGFSSTLIRRVLVDLGIEIRSGGRSKATEATTPVAAARNTSVTRNLQRSESPASLSAGLKIRHGL